MSVIEDLVDRAGRNAVCAGEHYHIQHAVNEALELAARQCDATASECAVAIRAMKVALPDWATPEPSVPLLRCYLCKAPYTPEHRCADMVKT